MTKISIMPQKAFLLIAFMSLSVFISCNSDKSSAKGNQLAEKSETVSKSSSDNNIVEESDNNEDGQTSEADDAQTNGSSENVKEEIEEKADETKDDKVEESEPLSLEQIQKADEIISSVTAANVDAVDTKKLFRMHCAICHGFKGNMMINGAKDLTKSKIPLNEAVAQIYHGKGLMTPYKGLLTDAEIVAMAKYAETLRK